MFTAAKQVLLQTGGDVSIKSSSSSSRHGKYEGVGNHPFSLYKVVCRTAELNWWVGTQSGSLNSILYVYIFVCVQFLVFLIVFISAVYI